MRSLKTAAWVILYVSALISAISPYCEAGNAVPSADRNAIPQQEISVVRARAAGGDALASVRLWRHYGLVENDLDESAFWLKLASEQGDCNSQVEFAKWLYYGRHDRARANQVLRSESMDRCARSLGRTREVERIREQLRRSAD
jgi:hypothetical protein